MKQDANKLDIQVDLVVVAIQKSLILTYTLEEKGKCKSRKE